MLGEGTSIIFVTFLLAIIGYIGLTIVVLISLERKIPFKFWRIIAAIILIHVAMVWLYRYNLQFSLAVRNGYTGFLIFNSALIMILISTFVKESLALILIRISFIVVTMGAIGATFRYDVVAIYKIPVLISATAGFTGFILSFILGRNNRIKLVRK